MSFEIRPGEPDDIGSIQSIYAREVETGTASFELVPPTAEEMLRRYQAVVDAGYTYLVAVDDNGVIGYAYTSSYRSRPGYRFSIEDSVYVHPSSRGRGIASNLLQRLIECSSDGVFNQMIAIIGDSANHASIELHRKQGFRHVGTIEQVGFKFERWIDTVIMQRSLR